MNAHLQSDVENSSRLFHRRRFLQLSGATLAGVALSNCRRNLSDVGSSGGASGDPDTLHLYSWSGYSDEDLLQSFTEATGITAIVDIFDSNETMLAKMQAGGGAAYSIIYPSDYMVQQMIELDLLTALDQSRLDGLDTLLENFRDPSYDAGNAHSVPYAWGTTGLVYNSTQLTPAPEDWEYLWDNQSKISRKMTLFNDVREVLGAVLRSLGYSYNSTNADEIEEAYQKLLELKPAIASFTTDGWRDQLLSGDLLMAMGYSSDAILVIEENPDLRYLVPASGSSLWTDTMVIPQTAPNVDAAYQWINFVYQPENAASLVERLRFATPIEPAIDQLPPELQNDTNLFPTDAVLANCEGIAPVDDVAEVYDRYWTQITSA